MQPVSIRLLCPSRFFIWGSVAILHSGLSWTIRKRKWWSVVGTSHSLSRFWHLLVFDNLGALGFWGFLHRIAKDRTGIWSLMVQRHLSESFSECCLAAFGPCFSGFIDVRTDLLPWQLAKATILQLNIVEQEKVTNNTMAQEGLALRVSKSLRRGNNSNNDNNRYN